MARAKKAKSFNKTPALAFDAHVAAYWKNKAESVHSSPAEALAFSEAVERQWSEDADALAADLAEMLDANPDVIRPKMRTLFIDLYELNDESNDWWNETQRAKAEAERVTAFAEKLEDLSPAVKRSQQNRKGQAEIEARRAELDARILAEGDAATAAARGKFPDTKRLQGVIDYEIAAALERKGVRVGGKPVGPKRIRQARKGR